VSNSKSNSLHPEDGGSKVLQNVDILPHQYVAHKPEDYDLNPMKTFAI